MHAPPTDQELDTIKADESAVFAKRTVLHVATKTCARCSCGCDFLDNCETSLIIAKSCGVPGRMRAGDQKYVYN